MRKYRGYPSKVGFALLLGTATMLNLTVSTANGNNNNKKIPKAVEPIENLGEKLFLDENLSINSNQSCASCHDLEWGTTVPDSAVNASGAIPEGSISGKHTPRKPPSSAYSTQTPFFHQRDNLEWVGGSLWDGRQTGQRYDQPAFDQPRGALTSLAVMGLKDPACVIFRVLQAPYLDLYIETWGDAIGSIDLGNVNEGNCGTEGFMASEVDRAMVEAEIRNIGISITQYEASSLHSPFSSRFDSWRRGKGHLTDEELIGFNLFESNCSGCHTTNGRSLLTSFEYANIGVPINPMNPRFMSDNTFRDLGLGGSASKVPAGSKMEQEGKMKVPTLRNVDRRPNPDDVKAYMHNGYFKTLKGVVHFYNTRDVLAECAEFFTEAQALSANCWPASEVSSNRSMVVGNLGLTGGQEDAIVAFLKTLSDK